MKASDLIIVLQHLIQEHGDLEVKYDDLETSFCRIDNVQLESESHDRPAFFSID